MNAAPVHSPATRTERRIALIKPAVDADDRAAPAMKLLDSVLWVFKGTTQSNWTVCSAEAAQVIVVHHREPAQHIAQWRSEGKLIVAISTDAAASPISPYTLNYPFQAVQALSILEHLDAELDSAATAKGPVSSRAPGDPLDSRDDSHRSDAWDFVEALSTLRLVSNADIWLVGRDSSGPVLWLQGDGSRYCCDSATARAIRMGTCNLGALTLQKTVARPVELSLRSGSELAWFGGYHASAQIAPWLSERATYRLARWPDFGRVRPDDPLLRAAQIRVLAALDAAPATVAELSARTNTSPEIAVRTLNALAGCELVEVAPTAAINMPSTKPASPVPAGRLRQRAGSGDIGASPAAFARKCRRRRIRRRQLTGGLRSGSQLSGRAEQCSAGTARPPVRFVMQANKRDLPDAIPLEQLRSMLESLQVRVGIVESIATEGTGVREAFVFAVRLALDRVRELMRNGDLPSVRPQIDTAEDLLGELQRAEAGALDLATASVLKHTRMQDVQDAQPGSLAAAALREAMRDEARSIDISPPLDAHGDGVPWLPDERVASGMIWPPVDGRLILHQTAGLTAQLHRHRERGWSGRIGDHWHVRSAADALFEKVDEGRVVLVQWARLHAACAGALSKERCISLAADGAGRFRLWQMVRVERSLRAEIEAALNGATDLLASTLLSAIRSFLHIAERSSAAGCELQLSLGNISLSASGPAYSGLMPDLSMIRSARRWSYAQASYQLFGELSFARPVLRERRDDLLEELTKLSRGSEKHAQGEWSLLQRLVVAQTYD